MNAHMKLAVTLVLMLTAVGCGRSQPQGRGPGPVQSGGATRSGRNLIRVAELEAERNRLQSTIQMAQQFIRDNDAENRDSISRGIYITIDNSGLYSAIAKHERRIDEIDGELRHIGK